MVSRKDSNAQRVKRHKRVRAKISGTADCPRLSVYRSTNNIVAQIIDDVAGVTLVSASTLEASVEGTGGNKEAARKKLQFGYFVLSENILLDTNEFYGIGSVQYPFAGVFDFRGYHVTLNILNEYKNDYYELDAQSHTSI